MTNDIREDIGEVTGLHRATVTSLREQRINIYKLAFEELVDGIFIEDDDLRLMFGRFDSICERLGGK